MSWPILPREPEICDSRSAKFYDHVALIVPLRQVFQTKYGGHSLADRRSLIPQLVQRSRGAAELNDGEILPEHIKRFGDAWTTVRARLRYGRVL